MMPATAEDGLILASQMIIATILMGILLISADTLTELGSLITSAAGLIAAIAALASALGVKKKVGHNSDRLTELENGNGKKE